MEELWMTLSQYVPDVAFNLAMLGTALVTGWLVAIVGFKAVQMTLKEVRNVPKDLVNQKFRFAFYLFVMIVTLNIFLSFATVGPKALLYIHKLLYIGLVFSFALLLIKVTGFIKVLLYNQFDITVADNLDGRKARTQIDFLQKLASVIIMFIAFAVVLMSFSRVRELGTSILASAGIAGIIVGFAAQKSLSNLLAGFQIAFTQPIRLDDVVVVEGEWGRIEEITLTYVVVVIWDSRRLVLPISYFIEKPFQNWTRVSSDILGPIFIYTDYSVPVDELRKELTRILENEGKKYWDGRVNVVQMTDATDKTVQVRALISAANSGNAWDLRCLVREKLIDFMKQNYPASLPKIRIEQKFEPISNTK